MSFVVQFFRFYLCRFAVCYAFIVTPKKYLVLLAIICFGSTGDTLLSRGMRDVGEIHLSNWTNAITAVSNPWIACGIVWPPRYR